jgi:hypothetical protein
MELKSLTPSTNCSTQAISFLGALHSAINEVKGYSSKTPNNVFPGVSTGVLRLSASSVAHPSAAAIRGRMDFVNTKDYECWCAGSTSNDEFIQASSPVPMIFSRIELKGRDSANEFIRSFKITYSSDGITWNNYKDGTIFTGASSNSEIFGMALEPFTARAIRIVAVSFISRVCTRLEVLISRGTSNKVLPDGALIATIACGFNVRATSALEPDRDVSRVVLNKVQPTGLSGWCAEINDINNWVMVGSFYKMTWKKIDIQGVASSSNWVKTFKVSYTVDGESWSYYNNGEILTGNYDDTSVVSVNLTPFEAIAVRMHPVTWNSGIGVRIEMYCSEI